MPYTIEQQITIWDDVNGTRVVIAPDSDGLGLITIKAIDAVDAGREITIPIEMARLMAKALQDFTLTHEVRLPESPEPIRT